MRDTADKIGPEADRDGRNDRYGFGRINAHQALAAARPPENVRGDFDGDGRSDVLVRKDNLLSDLETDGSVTFIGGLDSAWRVQGMGYYSPDARADVLVRNSNLESCVEADHTATFIGGLDTAWVI